MRRLIPVFVVLLGLAVAGPAAAAHHTAGLSKCARQQPVKVTFTRKAAATIGRLTWKAGPAAPKKARYRVVRNGKVVGQTFGHSMKVAVVPGRKYTFRVFLVLPSGRVVRCGAPTTKLSSNYRVPSAPTFLAAKAVSDTSATLSWQPSQRGDAAITGYRVLRSGAVYGQTRGTLMTVKVASAHTYTFTVVAVDHNGRVSAQSGPVKVQTGHTAPTPPNSLQAQGVSGTGVTLSWQASQGEGRIAYRVLRNGKPTGETSSTTVSVSNLTPSTTYAYSVQAVDSLGYVSPATTPISVHTAAPGAPTAPGSLLGAAVNASTVQLTWQASQPAQGRIVGYRVLRNGTAVGQFSATSATIGNLAASTTYTFTVIAIDSLGDQSDQSAQVTVTTANPVPTSGHAYAFLLSDTMESFQDFENHYTELGTVSPTYYDCNNSTNWKGANVPLITQWAQARQVKVLPRFNCQNGAVIDQILNNPSLSQQWINYIVGQTTADGYNGALLDLEAGFASDRNAYTAFVTQLAGQLHAVGKTLVLAVSAKTADVQNNPRSTFFDYNALSAQADALFVMAWGIHWATSAPGAQDDISWVQGVVSYISTLPRVNKYILGMQLYAMDWPNGGGTSHPASSYQYADAMSLAANLGVTPTYSSTSDAYTFNYTDGAGTPHTVWFTNAQTEADRITLAHNAGFGGVGFWRLGHEDQSVWNNPVLTGTW